MTMISGGAGPRRGHCGKPYPLQCKGAELANPCPCKDDVLAAIINNGGPIDYGRHYSPPPTPSPGSSGLEPSQEAP